MENLNPILGNVAYMQQWPQISKIEKLEKFSEDYCYQKNFCIIIADLIHKGLI